MNRTANIDLLELFGYKPSVEGPATYGHLQFGRLSLRGQSFFKC